LIIFERHFYFKTLANIFICLIHAVIVCTFTIQVRCFVAALSAGYENRRVFNEKSTGSEVGVMIGLHCISNRMFFSIGERR